MTIDDLKGVSLICFAIASSMGFHWSRIREYLDSYKED